MTAAHLGFDAGGTNFRVGIRLAGAGMLLDRDIQPASAAWGAGDFGDRIEEALERIVARHPGRVGRLAGVGGGLTGDIDPEQGGCSSMTRFPRLEGVVLGRCLEERFGVPVRLLNDGLVHTLAELLAGAGQGISDFLMVTLGTGIGGGIVMDGRLVTGAHGRFGKVGHQVIDADGPVWCHCGLPGCWQTFCAIRGVTERARMEAERQPHSRLADHVQAQPEIDLRPISELARAGDPAARRVMAETGRYLGIGLANLIKTFAPERAIVGGGIAADNPVLFETAQAVVNEYAVLPYQRIPVVPAAAGKDAGVLGATFLAEQER